MVRGITLLIIGENMSGWTRIRTQDLSNSRLVYQLSYLGGYLYHIPNATLLPCYFRDISSQKTSSLTICWFLSWGANLYRRKNVRRDWDLNRGTSPILDKCTALLSYPHRYLCVIFGYLLRSSNDC